MSYYIQLHLKQTDKPLETISKVQKYYQKNIDEFVKLNYVNYDYYTDISKQTSGDIIKQFSTVKFIYWKNYNLLGMIDTDINVKSYFNKTIEFQNYSDYDYPLDYWPKEIEPFKSIIEKYKPILDKKDLNKDDIEIIKEHLKKYMKIDDEEELKSMGNNYEYYLLSSIHNELVQKLDIDNILYNRTNPNIDQYSILMYANPLDIHNIRIKLKDIIQKEYGGD